MFDDDLAAEYGRYNYGAPLVSDTMPIESAPTNPWGLPANSGQPAGTMDLSYWLSRGVTPEQIFDANGQIKPGWTRTARGYEQTGGGGAGGGGVVYGPEDDARDGLTGGYYDGSGRWVRGTRSTGGVGGIDGGFGPGPQLRSLDSLWPDYNPPRLSAPPKFSYADFTAPTLQDAENEPGYAFAATQGRKGVEATKAAQGVYRSGQTLKDIYAWASEFAKQNYSGVFDRALRTYDVNRSNAADNYMTNYGISRDVFDRDYNSYSAGNQSLRRKAELDFGRDWDLYEADRDTKKFLVDAGNDR